MPLACHAKVGSFRAAQVLFRVNHVVQVPLQHLQVVPLLVPCVKWEHFPVKLELLTIPLAKAVREAHIHHCLVLHPFLHACFALPVHFPTRPRQHRFLTANHVLLDFFQAFQVVQAVHHADQDFLATLLVLHHAKFVHWVHLATRLTQPIVSNVRWENLATLCQPRLVPCANLASIHPFWEHPLAKRVDRVHSPLLMDLRRALFAFQEQIHPRLLQVAAVNFALQGHLLHYKVKQRVPCAIPGHLTIKADP